MKYTEKIGDIETAYEGTLNEITELYNRMKPKELKADFKVLVEQDNKAKERYDNLKHFGVVELDTNELISDLARKMQLALSQI